MTKKVNGQSQGEYVEYKTVGKTTSLSQSRDDMGMLLLDKEMPAENVPPPMKQGTTCKNDEWVQAGFGLDGNAQAPKCPRFARYKTVTSRAVYGLGVAGGSQYVFFAVPKDKKAKDTGLGCNGDSGGPLYCQVGGRWVYSGLMTSSIPHTSKNEKGEDVPDAAWVAPSKICENVTDAEENAKAACDNEKLSAEDRKKACDSLPAIQQPRRNACAEACKLAYAIGGYRISEVHDNIGYMKDYLPLPEKTKSGSKVQEYEN